MYNSVMTIYIETFLIENIIINFCLLRLVELTTKTYTNLFKLILSSTIAAIFSVISAIFLTNTIVINVLKLTCSVIMILTAFKCNLKQFIFDYILLFAYTYAISGAVISLSSATYNTGFGLIISSKINLNMICLFVVAISYIIQLATKHLKHNLKTNNYIYKTTLENNNNKITINAYLDTGNLLNYNGNPVIILNLESYLKLTKTSFLDFYLCKSEYINTNTVTGSNQLKIFKIDKLTIKNKSKKIEIHNQHIAVNTNINFNDCNYQALLSPLML